jgi:glutathione S-transferase
MVLHLPALVALLTVLLLGYAAWFVGRARGRYGVKAPATTGPVEFERAFRAEVNTHESALMFLPSMWLFGQYVNPLVAGVLGVVWIVLRVWYLHVYAAGARRTVPFVASALITVGFALTALVFVVRAMIVTS